MFVLESAPDEWIDGVLHRLRSGDALAFPAGTGIAHCLINDTEAAVRILVVGENNPNSRAVYPVNPERQNPTPWTDAPVRHLGPHDGRPKYECRLCASRLALNQDALAAEYRREHKLAQRSTRQHPEVAAALRLQATIGGPLDDNSARLPRRVSAAGGTFEQGLKQPSKRQGARREDTGCPYNC